ncbi:MAG: hypothetical protein J6Y17_00890 [Elusimicrobiaceae bacterium]|nr:hypothetical protein [Elusimicrobiaceae bacterium]
MFTFKPKKVFEKINKMDRKQAYTIGAIVVVSVVALLMLISAMTGGEDGSFEGMKARGYDLANMPFATDEAEKFLLANAYPDMRENGSTLLYSAAEKEARQEADEQAAEEYAYEGSMEGAEASSDSGDASTDRGGYGGYGGGGSGRRGGRTPTKTEMGQLGAAGMASAGGTGVSATWGPTGDFRQYKGREDRGHEAPAPLVIGKQKEAAAFRTASAQAIRGKGDRAMTDQKKALMQLSLDGQNPVPTAPTIGSTGGFQIEDGALPHTTGLENLDKKVAEAVKKAEKQQKEEKREWWEEMLIDLAKQAASSLVASVMDGVGDHVKGWINGNSASRAARTQYATEQSGKSYDKLTKSEQAAWEAKGRTAEDWDNNRYSAKEKMNTVKNGTEATSLGKSAKSEQQRLAQGTTHTAEVLQVGQKNNNNNNSNNNSNDNNSSNK